jgi:hypothetical protein
MSAVNEIQAYLETGYSNEPQIQMMSQQDLKLQNLEALAYKHETEICTLRSDVHDFIEPTMRALAEAKDATKTAFLQELNDAFIALEAEHKIRMDEMVEDFELRIRALLETYALPFN